MFECVLHPRREHSASIFVLLWNKLWNRDNNSKHYKDCVLFSR